MSHDARIGFEAIALTNEVLWAGVMPEDRESKILALTAEAGSIQKFLESILLAGDLLLRTAALLADEPVETIIAEMREELA